MEATAATLERRVRVIPATRKPEELHRDHDGKMRVAAYCRVSTDSEEQLNSYEAQKTYYTQKIQDSPDWEMAGIYADEGISGTSLKKRTQFNKMITACKRGHIDLIITKSLSRFARNTVDCLDISLCGLGVVAIATAWLFQIPVKRLSANILFQEKRRKRSLWICRVLCSGKNCMHHSNLRWRNRFTHRFC